MKWRRTLITLHRDVGFLAVGLTLVYAVSGIAVNHREHWDFNWSRELRVEHIGSPAELLNGSAGTVLVGAGEPGEVARANEAELVRRITAATGRTKAPYKAFWRSRDRLSLFFGRADEDVVDYKPSQGLATHERRRDRFLIRPMNFLHLNEGRKAWTWLADGYAAALLFLALSGTLIVKGRKGLIGRGGIYLLLGVLLPVVAWVLMAR